MSDSETIYSESEISSDSDSEGSLVDFVADSDEEEPDACLACHAEICVSNIINRKRRRTPAVREESSDDDEDDESEDSDYVPSESGSDGSDGSDDSSCDENGE